MLLKIGGTRKRLKTITLVRNLLEESEKKVQREERMKSYFQSLETEFDGKVGKMRNWIESEVSSLKD